MNNRKDAIQKHLSDQIGLERHILEAIERQREDEKLREEVEANKLVIQIERILNQHVTALENLAEAYDAQVESVVKKAVTELLGVAAGLYDKVRDHKVSRMLRDDYTALSLAAMGYTAFHTFGLGIKEERIANLALSHLKDLTPLLVELSKVLPVMVAKEGKEEYDFAFDNEVGTLAVSNTQEAWSTEAIKQPA